MSSISSVILSNPVALSRPSIKAEAGNISDVENNCVQQVTRLKQQIAVTTRLFQQCTTAAKQGSLDEPSRLSATWEKVKRTFQQYSAVNLLLQQMRITTASKQKLHEASKAIKNDLKIIVKLSPHLCDPKDRTEAEAQLKEVLPLIDTAFKESITPTAVFDHLFAVEDLEDYRKITNAYYEEFRSIGFELNNHMLKAELGSLKKSIFLTTLDKTYNAFVAYATLKSLWNDADLSNDVAYQLTKIAKNLKKSLKIIHTLFIYFNKNKIPSPFAIEQTIDSNSYWLAEQDWLDRDDYDFPLNTDVILKYLQKVTLNLKFNNVSNHGNHKNLEIDEKITGLHTKFTDIYLRFKKQLIAVQTHSLRKSSFVKILREFSSSFENYRILSEMPEEHWDVKKEQDFCNMESIIKKCIAAIKVLSNYFEAMDKISLLKSALKQNYPLFHNQGHSQNKLPVTKQAPLPSQHITSPSLLGLTYRAVAALALLCLTILAIFFRRK